MNHILDAYIKATNTHNFKEVEKLLHPEAMYWFSNQTCDSMETIEQYFNNSWNYIKDEIYSARDVTWLTADTESATCIYTYHYQGYIEGKFVTGNGRATNVFKLINGEWKLIHEHLSSIKI
ncbi:YybH family protein [Alkalicoccobacillus porphyridii]|uniref:Nuclear transport factor 2 family protein n=1 Tax=Alkalicoccobacillus porphyridii TaxID=2597270 RepID=A0A553ZWA2_9BACI|nr:nuclear transport factor 2 family protein [Alkalicoccobacillus porphyridii]TSB45737.1 nuclear transport factor 2 family protein [Alkalicoccobacillus porphyridii]